MKTKLIKILKKILNKLERKNDPVYINQSNIIHGIGSVSFGTGTYTGSTGINTGTVITTPNNETYRITESAYNTIISFLDRLLKQKHLDIDFNYISEYNIQFSVTMDITPPILNKNINVGTIAGGSIASGCKNIKVFLSYDVEKKQISFSFNNIFGTSRTDLTYGNVMYKSDSYDYFKSLYEKCININNEILEKRITTFLTDIKQDFNMLRQEKLDELLSN